MQEEQEMQQLNEDLRQKLLPDGGMVTKYIVLVEYIDNNGDIDLIMNESQGLEMWDREGLLHHALFSWSPEIEDEVLGDGDDDEEDDD